MRVKHLESLSPVNEREEYFHIPCKRAGNEKSASSRRVSSPREHHSLPRIETVWGEVDVIFYIWVTVGQKRSGTIYICQRTHADK